MPRLHGERIERIGAHSPSRAWNAVRVAACSAPGRNPVLPPRSCIPSMVAAPVLEGVRRRSATSLRHDSRPACSSGPADGFARVVPAAPCSGYPRWCPRRGSRPPAAGPIPSRASTVRDSRTTRERYSRSLYQSGCSPISVNAVHEHKRAADDVVQRGRVLQHHQVAVVRRHREAERQHRVAPVSEQQALEIRIGPRLGDHACAVARHPLFFGEVFELLDELTGLHAAFVKRSFDRRRALLDAGDRWTQMDEFRHRALQSRLTSIGKPQRRGWVPGAARLTPR